MDYFLVNNHFLFVVFVRELQIQSPKEQGRYRQSGNVDDGHSEQLHFGDVSCWLHSRPQIVHSLHHTRLRANGQDLLSNSFGLLRRRSQKGTFQNIRPNFYSGHIYCNYHHFNSNNFLYGIKVYCWNRVLFQEKLRMKIVERLMKEGSNADEPMNIKLSDYSR